MRPSVLIADDHRLDAEGLASLLSPQCHVVAIAEDGAQLVELASRHRPDLIVTDLSMPKMSGLDAIVELSRRGSAARFIVLTMHQEVSLAVLAFRAGASAFLLKTSRSGELIEALRRVQLGERFLSVDFPQTLEAVLGQADAETSSGNYL